MNLKVVKEVEKVKQWVKTQITGFQSANYQPLRCYEDIMVFSKGGIVPQAKMPMVYFPQGIISLNLKVARGGIDYLSEKKLKMQDKKDMIQEYGNYPRNVIQFPREANLFHPTQKPMNLMEYLIMTYSKEGELILDFTSGSGSTLLACERINRKWIGIELTDKYCEVIKKRIQDGIQLKIMLDYK